MSGRTTRGRGPWSWLRWASAALLLLAVAIGVRLWLEPPPPAVAEAHGLAGQRYAPDVLGWDEEGWLLVNGERHAEPDGGRVDLAALVDVATARWALRPKDPALPGAGIEWQVLDVAPATPFATVAAVAEALQAAGVRRLAFVLEEPVATGAPAEHDLTLVHAWPLSSLGPSCGAALGSDPSILPVLVESEWEQPVYRVGDEELGRVEWIGRGELAGRVADARVEHALVSARSEASFADVAFALRVLEQRGLRLALPAIAPDEV